MRYRKALTILMLAGTVGLLALPDIGLAFDDVAAQATATAVDAAAEDAAAESEAEVIDYADTGWDLGYTINTLIMLLCAVLVLFMQAGFALVEVGLNSQKNAINILFKNLMDLCLGVVLFVVFGYGLMYPGDDYAGKWFGFGSSMVTRDAQAGASEGSWEEPPSSLQWSNTSDFMFQVAFCATAATIVSGAVAGRMKFVGYLIYTMIITGLVYPVSGMWKWGGGALAEMGFHDFAGSIVVHAVGGMAGLAGAIALGPRIGRYTQDGKSVPMPGHNIPFAALGVFILWIGWYGFNPGSQLTYNGATNAEATTYIALTTTLAAAAGAISAMILSWAKFGKPDVTMALNGVLAGLVGITANCDRVSQVEALAIGAIAGVVVFAGILALDKLKIDDPVGAVPVHGFCGIWGGLATGIFGDIPDGLADRSEFFLVQLKSSVIICAWAFGTMLIVFYGLKAAGLLRVSAEEEQRGLDIGEHGMEAYTLT